ncbi:MAG: hypothetical protein M1269_01685 [Chloroflexi bacterium]|nr:hypothetical protein [Chloroflexota bacterium]
MRILKVSVILCFILMLAGSIVFSAPSEVTGTFKLYYPSDLKVNQVHQRAVNGAVLKALYSALPGAGKNDNSIKLSIKKKTGKYYLDYDIVGVDIQYVPGRGRSYTAKVSVIPDYVELDKLVKKNGAAKAVNFSPVLYVVQKGRFLNSWSISPAQDMILKEVKNYKLTILSPETMEPPFSAGEAAELLVKTRPDRRMISRIPDGGILVGQVVFNPFEFRPEDEKDLYRPASMKLILFNNKGEASETFNVKEGGLGEDPDSANNDVLEKLSVKAAETLAESPGRQPKNPAKHYLLLVDEVKSRSQIEPVISRLKAHNGIEDAKLIYYWGGKVLAFIDIKTTLSADQVAGILVSIKSPSLRLLEHNGNFLYFLKES